ncbi:MAG TPA: FecR domain-containing protein [Anseongella sp.]
MEMISASSHEQAIKELIAEEIERLEQSGEAIDIPLSNERAAEIFTRIIQSGAEAPVIPLVQPKRKWVGRVAAAAAILLLVGGSSYFWIHTAWEKKSTITAVSSFKNDVAPGSNKAILTLANGSTIILDNVHKGQLTSQGNTKVMKIDSGLLAYKGENSDVLSKRNGEAKNKIIFNTLSTPRGGEYQLILPDGSRVWLNAASSIRFPTVFTGKEREVEITGEAYFEIEKNTNMPFVVKKGNVEVQVLGTHFNVKAYDDEANITVTLLEGSVKVIAEDRGLETVIMPGQQARINNVGQIALVKNADMDRAIAWKEGRFEFHGNIQDIMRQIARWYNVEVEYRGDMTQKDYGGAISRYENISKVLKMLELTGSIHFEIEKDAAPGEAGKIIVEE